MGLFGFGRNNGNEGTPIGANAREAFNYLSLSFKNYPDGSSHPGNWIARGVPKTKPEKVLEPKSGKWASYGVFFSDNHDNLVTPGQGIIYVYDSNHFSWIPSPSRDWSRLVERKTSELQVNPASIRGGFDAERALYETYCVFQTNSGIATINYPIRSSDAAYILVCSNNCISILS